jgi:hypothetical protein
MSTITTTPAPSLPRTPLLVGAGVVGIAVAVAIAVPALTSRTGTTVVPAPSAGAVAVPRAGGPDVAEAHGLAARLRLERQLDKLAKTDGNAAGLGVATSALVPASIALEQVGGGHRTYAWSRPRPLSSHSFDSQIGGRHSTFEYTPSSTHTVWNDRFVPPYQDPAWGDAIQRHYFGTRGGV